MFIVDLCCEKNHTFEGWYKNAAELRELEANDEVTCPLCESKASQIPTASRISTSKTGKSSSSPKAARQVPVPAPAQIPLEVQQAMAKVVQYVRSTHADVGENFAKRATAMHRGEEEAAPILGTTTKKEEEALREEGVGFAKIPIPDIEQN